MYLVIKSLTTWYLIVLTVVLTVLLLPVVVELGTWHLFFLLVASTLMTLTARVPIVSVLIRPFPSGTLVCSRHFTMMIVFGFILYLGIPLVAFAVSVVIVVVPKVFILNTLVLNFVLCLTL